MILPLEIVRIAVYVIGLGVYCIPPDRSGQKATDSAYAANGKPT
jgi:hypothetical protein